MDLVGWGLHFLLRFFNAIDAGSYTLRVRKTKKGAFYFIDAKEAEEVSKYQFDPFKHDLH